MKKQSSYKRPTDLEYANYTGRHCRVLWRNTTDNWNCPVCGRTKREILKWGPIRQSGGKPTGEVGFTCSLINHHDHSAKGNRFTTTLICGGCNTLDARMKKLLKAPGDFSFSPDEMKQCIHVAFINGPIKYDLIKASILYFSLKEK